MAQVAVHIGACHTVLQDVSPCTASRALQRGGGRLVRAPSGWSPRLHWRRPPVRPGCKTMRHTQAGYRV